MVADGSVVAATCSYLSGTGRKERISGGPLAFSFFQDSSGTAYMDGRSSAHLETFSRIYPRLCLVNALGAY